MKQFFTEIRITAIAVTCLLLVGWFTAKPIFSHRNTDKSVVALADRLDGQVERGRYKRTEPATVTEADAWGHQLRIEYREEGIGERLLVLSAGPDGAFDTEDDITANRFLMNAKGIGEEIKDGTASVAKETAKGLIRGVKEEVKDTFKKKADKAGTQ